MRFPNRVLAIFATAGLAVLIGSTVVEAHPKRRAHRHAHRTAVIVVGQPKPAARVVVINGARYGTLDLNVKPRATEVWVDGEFRGTCEAFDGHPDKLVLAPGMHRLKLVTPDGIEVSRDVRVRAGLEFNVGLDLR